MQRLVNWSFLGNDVKPILGSRLLKYEDLTILILKTEKGHCGT